jgi:hypothetical protein
MTVTVKYVYTASEGAEVINFEDWVKTLSADAQSEFANTHRAHARAVAMKTSSGALKVEYTPEMTYVWASAEAADAGLGADPLWEQYHNRYLAENNIKLEIIKE